jgi:membrane fusion protein (multidrug efflux system)
LIAERDYQQGRAEAQRQRAVVEGLKATLARIEQEHNTRDRDRACVARSDPGADGAHHRSVARIAGGGATARGGDRTLRGSRAGIRRLGEVASLRPGSVVHPGQRLGVIVPSGKLIAVAQFAPSAVIGRIRPGQSARLRLDGFHGRNTERCPRRSAALAAKFAMEPCGLNLWSSRGLDRESRWSTVCQGSIEVALEEITPFTLLLRAAGALQAAPPPPLRAMAAEGGR